MFAKLKEKIQKEGGSVIEKDRGLSVLPGHASPRRTSLSNTSSPISKDSPAGLDLSGFIGEELEDKFSYASQDEAVAALQKRTDLCRRLEAKLQEYTSVIKDNNAKIEKLENFIEKQQDANARKTQELSEQHQTNMTKLSDSYRVEMEKKNMEVKELQVKLHQLEAQEGSMNASSQKFREQEAQVIQQKQEIQSMSGQIQVLQSSHDQLTSEIKNLQDSLKKSEMERGQLAEESVGHGKVVTSLTKERMALEETVADLKELLAQKSSNMAGMQSKHADLENAYQALLHSSETQKNKSKQLIQEQEDQIEQLRERVKLLEQREMNEALPGDERSQALEKERELLEKKLTETREQLSQVKSSWSEKISQLEEQISHLNTKIVEDSEDLKQAQQQTATVRQEMQKEIDQLKKKLNEAEKKLTEAEDLANIQKRQCSKEKLELETELSRLKLERTEVEAQTGSTLAALRSQISNLEVSQAQLRSELEETSNALRTMRVSYEECKKEVLDKDLELSDHRVQIQTLRDELHMTKETLQMMEDASHESASELNTSNKDKDELMVRNAELSHQVTTLQTSCQDLQTDLEKVEKELTGKTESEARLQSECHVLQERVQQLSETVSHNVQNTEDVARLEQVVETLELQLAEKNKALKKQDQRLNELKKTLQRELKVQSLPNDEQVDAKMVAVTPPLPRKNQVSRALHATEHGNLARKLSRESSPFPNDSLQEVGASTQGSLGTEDFFVGQGHRNSHHVSTNYHAMLHVNSQHNPGAFSVHSKNGSSGDRTMSVNEFDTRHLEKDINFQYLKHVVMKFMLSRENEAIHLIKAVSLLLRFTPEEQKLIKDTLTWKMSWFGGSQPPAVVKGLSSKIIPPSY